MRAALRSFTDFIAIPYLATFVVFLIALMLSFVLPSGNPVERVIGAPVFGLPILVGAFAGYVINRRQFSWTAMFSWVVPAVVFWLAYKELTQPQNMNPRPWHNLVGVDCSSSECLYEFLATIPLVCALTYSATALLLHLRNRKVVDGPS
jgi:hypothetical protein